VTGSVRAEASAPGKLFVSGEYVILSGAPALVAAVDRRARVQVLEGEGRPGTVTVVSEAEGRTVCVAEPLAGALGDGDVAAVVAAVRAVAARVPALLAAPLHVRIDSRPFLSGRRKFGLGRSAATLVAATHALLAAAGRDPGPDGLATALEANALLQGGQGSGADVAAATRGGLVEVVRSGGALATTARRLPAGLHLVVGWTGEPAPTVPLLDRFAAALARAPGVTADLAEAAHSAARAVAAGDARGLVAAVDRSADLLVRLGETLDLPVVTPALARLVAAARRAGAVAKPSGAGAGDCGVALCDSPARVRAVRAAWEAEGLVPLAVAITADGVGPASPPLLGRRVAGG